jgi:hypothetical protein
LHEKYYRYNKKRLNCDHFFSEIVDSTEKFSFVWSAIWPLIVNRKTVRFSLWNTLCYRCKYIVMLLWKGYFWRGESFESVDVEVEWWCLQEGWCFSIKHSIINYKNCPPPNPKNYSVYNIYIYTIILRAGWLGVVYIEYIYYLINRWTVQSGGRSFESGGRSNWLVELINRINLSND